MESTKRSAEAKPTKHAPSTSPEERRRMIAEAAYYRAEKRGFKGGDPTEDWIAAQKEVDEALGVEEINQKKEQLAAYEKMRQEVMKILQSVPETINANTLKQAIEGAGKRLKDLGEYTSDTVNKASEAIRREMASTAEKLGPRWEDFSEKSTDLFEVWRGRGSEFFGKAANAAGDWLKQFRSQKGEPEYHTGEMAQRGTFECKSCGYRLSLEKPDYLPVCPRCFQTTFRQK